MSLHIKSRHCTVDDTLKAYVQKKLDRLPRYYHKVNGIEVIFTEEKIGVSCEIEVIGPCAAGAPQQPLHRVHRA